MEMERNVSLVKTAVVFRHLSKDQTERVAAALVRRCYVKGECVLQQGEPGGSLFVIASGQVSITIDGRHIRTQGKHGCFGERALLFGERRTGSVHVSSSEAELFTMDREIFEQIVAGKMREDLMHRISIQDTQVSLQDLACPRIIGMGEFGVVRIVQHRTTGVRYALKTVRKEKGSIPSLLRNECAILAENDHPFTLYMVKTFETASRISILMELVTGGDLFQAIRKFPKALPRQHAQFYIGSLVIAIEAIWDRNIIYRDLKPENVMLDSHGYIKIIDFGVSKVLHQRDSRTFTVIGTPHYIAPEIVAGGGYAIQVDLWSLGVMLFELVCGRLPFAHRFDDSSDIIDCVLHDPVRFPKWYTDSDGRALINGLLCRRVPARLGAGRGGLADVKEAAFFRVANAEDNTLFDNILGRELEPPLLPEGETYCDEGVLRSADQSDKEELWPTEYGNASSGEKGCCGVGPVKKQFMNGFPGLPCISRHAWGQ